MGKVQAFDGYKRRLKSVEARNGFSPRITMFVRVTGEKTASFESVSFGMDEVMMLAVSGFVIENLARKAETPSVKAAAEEVFALWKKHFGDIEGGSRQ